VTPPLVRGLAKDQLGHDVCRGVDDKSDTKEVHEAGCDPSKDLFPNYTLLEGSTPLIFALRQYDTRACCRRLDLMTTLDGLFAAGNRCTGRQTIVTQRPRQVCRKKSADYACDRSAPVISKDQNRA